MTATILNDYATTIIDSAGILLSGRYGALAERQHGAIKTIIANAERFVHIYAEFESVPLEDVSSMTRHELGNHLTPIRGYSDLLIMGAIGDLTAEQQVHVQAIFDATTILREEVDKIVGQARELATLKAEQSA